MIGAPNSMNLNCKVRVTKEVPGPSVSEEIVDIFTNYNIDTPEPSNTSHNASRTFKIVCALFSYRYAHHHEEEIPKHRTHYDVTVTIHALFN